MKTLLLVLIGALSFSFYSHANGLQEATLLYQNKDYQKALTIYESLDNKYPNSVPTLYNLGNTHIQLGNIGKGIVYYKRALRFEPRNKDILHNLEIAQSKMMQTTNKEFFLDVFVNELIGLLSLNEWALLWTLSLMIFAVIMVPIIQRKATERIKIMATISAIIISVTSIVLWVQMSDVIKGTSAIVIEKKVALKSGPSDSLKTLIYVHDGVSLEVIKNVKGWSEVELDNGFRGWLKQAGFWKL